MFPGKIECLVDGEKTSDIEIIQRHHRYAVVWPSIHPEGRQYQWFDADGNVIDGPPRKADLPELPAMWLEGLSEKDKKTRASDAVTTISGQPLYDVTKALTEGEPSEKVAKRLGWPSLPATADPATTPSAATSWRS
jgi:Bifunctional DNA primase/polymerase, N-terminal